jgi:hypothetical protein
MEVSGQLHDTAALPPRKQPAVLTVQEAGGLKSCLNVMEKGNMSSHCQELNQSYSAVQPMA